MHRVENNYVLLWKLTFMEIHAFRIELGTAGSVNEILHNN